MNITKTNKETQNSLTKKATAFAVISVLAVSIFAGNLMTLQAMAYSGNNTNTNTSSNAGSTNEKQTARQTLRQTLQQDQVTYKQAVQTADLTYKQAEIGRAH